MRRDTVLSKCASCGAKYEQKSDDFGVLCPKCKSRPIRMTFSRYVIALRRLHRRIKDGLELVFWDDTTIGNKDTYCSWGLCCSDKEMWPDACDHLWPHEFTEHGRVAPLYHGNKQWCPFDKRIDDRGKQAEYSWGCFWRCVFFQSPRAEIPTRQQALEIVEKRIEDATFGKHDPQGASSV